MSSVNLQHFYRSPSEGGWPKRETCHSRLKIKDRDYPETERVNSRYSHQNCRWPGKDNSVKWKRKSPTLLRKNTTNGLTTKAVVVLNSS